MHWPCACSFLIQLLFFCQHVSSSAGRLRIDRESGHFIDSAGRVLILHGVNVVQKNFPWHPSLGSFDSRSSLNAEDMMNLKNWGFNAVRLGVMWPGVEPQMGEYNATYLDIMRQIIDDLYSHGIYTIVDLHQDSMSEQWCGEGIPAWMLPMLQPLMTSCDGVTASVARAIGQCKTFSSFNISIDPRTGYPKESGCLERTFDAYSRTPELVSAWGNFYENKSIQQKLHSFWSRVATEFSNSSGVLGYDLLNEPLNGNFFSDPHRIIPGYLDEHVLQPLYQSLHDVIVAADPQAIIMYEPPPFPDTYPVYIPWEHGVHRTGFTSGPARDRVEHQALSYHIYSCGFAVKDCTRSGDAPAQCPVCDQLAEDAVTTRAADAKRVGGGIFLTEFGACSGSEGCIAELRRVLSSADSAFQSWAYWQFKYNHDITTVSGPLEGFYKLDGSLQTAKVAALSRTFAPAIAGLPKKMTFEPSTGAFRLIYTTQKATAHLPTEIFLNRDLNYKSTAYITSCLNGEIQSNGTNLLYVTPSAAGTQVSVAVARSYEGARAGTFQSKDNDLINWVVSENVTSPGFELSTATNITYWKSLKVFVDDGMLCELSLQDSNHGPERCDLRSSQLHDLLFNYRIEVWKAKSFGRHEHVDTIAFSNFGPLLAKRISFTWAADTFGLPADNELLI